MIQQARMSHACCIGLNPGWKKMIFQLAVNKTLYPNPQLLTQRLLKQRQRKKTNETMLCAPLPPPLIGFPHKFHNIRIEKQTSMPF